MAESGRSARFTTAQSQVNSPAKGFVSSSMSVPCMSSLTLHEGSEATDCRQKLMGPLIEPSRANVSSRRRRLSDARLCPLAVLTMASLAEEIVRQANLQLPHFLAPLR